MPAVELLSADGRADAHAVIETFIETHAVADTRTDARTDDGDARAHTTTVGVAHTCALLATDNRSAVLKTDAVALLVKPLLERQEYGSYRLR